jgi:hypothetical protein
LDTLYTAGGFLRTTEGGKRVPVPRWAVTGFGLYRNDFLQALKKKEVTKDNYSKWSKTHATVAPVPKKVVNQKEIEEQWSSVKVKFKGVTLCLNPMTDREKQFLAAFHKLEKLNPHWPNKPKLQKVRHQERRQTQRVDPRFKPVPQSLPQQQESSGFMIPPQFKQFMSEMKEIASYFIISK